MICDECLVLFKVKYLLDGPSIVYTRRAMQLHEAASSCPFCEILYKWLHGIDEDERPKDWSWQPRFPNSSPIQDTVRYRTQVCSIVDYAKYIGSGSLLISDLIPAVGSSRRSW